MEQRLYPVSLAVTQACHVAAERRLGPVCTNAMQRYRHDMGRLVPIEVINDLVQSIIMDTEDYS